MNGLRIVSATALAGVCWSSAALADASSPDATQTERPAPRASEDIPILTYTYQATGASPRSLGAEAYGLGSAASGGVGYAGAKHGILGGGITMWGSPVDRLTLVVDAVRDPTGNFAPSAAAVVRILGRPGDGFSLGALAKFKIEGFGVGPNDEIESEVEAGLLASYAGSQWHLDLNAITGFGTGDDGEVDTEGRLRIGRDLGEHVRLGVDGQARYRLAGTERLVGGRKGDFTGGPQILVSGAHLFGAFTAGPTSTNVFDGIGWTAVATIGGTTL